MDFLEQKEKSSGWKKVITKIAKNPSDLGKALKVIKMAPR